MGEDLICLLQQQAHHLLTTKETKDTKVSAMQSLTTPSYCNELATSHGSGSLCAEQRLEISEN
jgi:hypothetical protein